MQEKNGAVLVIGAGVGGIRSALDLAESGYKVYLTDRNPAIGGALLQLETWFPDNQCELCKLLPVFSRDECSQVCLRRDLMHPNIELIPNSRVSKLSGKEGDFKATLNIKSRWVIEERCTACDLCAQVCPVEIGDEFNRGLQKRKAIYIRNPQAIPNVYTIDQEHCTKCGKCVEICPTKAVVLNKKDETKELSVGAVILSAGATELPANQMGQYGYGYYANVLSNIQLERLLADAGPTHGELLRPSDNKPPKKIAILQCVGSRDMDRNYCSEACCMYALKESILLRERYPDAEVTIYYMDIRAFGKDYYRYHLQAKEKGVKFARSRVSRIRENPKTKNLFLLARDEAGKSISAEYDMAVLSVAQCPSPELTELSKIMNINTNKWGFIETPGFYISRTTKPGIFVGGSASGPSDIAETVIKSSAAASEAAGILAKLQKPAGEKKTAHKHEAVKDENIKIAVYICQCGKEVSSIVDMEKTKEFVKKLPNVTSVEDVGFLCLPETLDKVKQAVASSGANRVIFAACAPYRYQRLFSNALAEVGIDASQWQLVNFREQLAWVHKDNPTLATRKAQNLLAMAAERLSTQAPLEVPVAEMTHNCLVVGGGISGMTAALNLADQGFDVTLVEKTGELGGHSRNIYYDLIPDNPQALVKGITDKVKSNPKIKVLLNSELTGISGHIGHFKSQIKSGDKVEQIQHGAVIIATGASDYQPVEYQYGKDARVITQHELQKRLAEKKLGKPATIVMIQCVGSRNSAHPYCNRTCCSEAITNARKIKEVSPETQIFILNRDIMAYGFKEQYYTQAREAGVLFHRYEPESEPQVTAGEKVLSVEWPDPALPGKLAIDTDLLVLSTGYIANESNAAIAKMLAIPLTEDGFFKEIDTKFRPVDVILDGVFITGLANAPRSLSEKIMEAQAAAQRAANVLSREQLTSGRIISEVDKRRCSCCGLCVEACPFDARSLNEEEHYAVVEETLCQGCGMCVSVCPNDAAKLRGQKEKQVFSMITLGL